jgi:HlyD family secretion protein
VLAAAAAGIYYYVTIAPTELVLTGVVTTNDVIVAPQIGGRLAEVRVQEGDEVKSGQLLAFIEPEELRADSVYAAHTADNLKSQIATSEADLRYEQGRLADEIGQAESNLAASEAQQAAAVADLEGTKLTFDRVQNLSKQGVASAQELDTARTTYQAAEARVEALRRQVDVQRASVALARTNAEQVSKRRSAVQASQFMQQAAVAQQQKADVRLTYTEIKAPIDGIVDVRAARTGEVVSAGQAVVTLVNPDDLWVRVDVEETYIDRVKLGDHLKVILPSGAELDGVVFYRGVDAGFATQRDVSRTKRDIKTFEVRLRVDNKDRRLAVGMTAHVLFPLQS